MGSCCLLVLLLWLLVPSSARVVVVPCREGRAQGMRHAEECDRGRRAPASATTTTTSH